MEVKNWAREFAILLLLMLLPYVAVSLIKQTQWGPILSTPINRQLGQSNAKVVIVEYSDFQCPSCAMLQPTIKDLLRRYDGKTRLAYKYFPLKMHKNALPAAHAAECASEQNKFFPFSDRLFEQQKAWSTLSDATTSFVSIGEEIKLDLEKFKACYADPSKRAAIMADVKEGQERQVNATPTFFIGEERLVGGVLGTDGARVIERELRK